MPHISTLVFATLTTLMAACAAVSSVAEPLVGDGPSVPPAPPPAAPGQTGLAGVGIAWEWQEDARPMALAVGQDRLAVIVSDGRFLWLDSLTGRGVAGGFLWPDQIRGESWGQISLYADMALVVAIETFQPEPGDFPVTRSRVVMFDRQGSELWQLPELGDKHLYSAALGPQTAFIGTHRGFEDNQLAAYDMLDGQIRWRYQADDYGFERLVADGQRIYSTLIDASGGGIAAYDLQSGALLWSEYDPVVRLADSLLLENGQLFVLTQPAAVALDVGDGQLSWLAEIELAPEAGIAVSDQFLYVVPAPTSALGNRPGLLGVDASDGSLAWHALAGLIADPLAVSGDALWAVVKDPDAGIVSLSLMEAATGLERARLPLGTNLELQYSLVAEGDVVYVLGDTMLAYQIPR